MPSPSLSPEPAPHATVSVKDRARNWQAATPSSSPTPDAVGDALTTESESELPPPPTIEEIEAMEKAAAAGRDNEEEKDGEVCHTPSGSSLSASNNNSKQYSRQVSRVSGTGRTAVRGSTPRAMAAAAAEKAAAAATIAEEAASGPQRRGRQQGQRDFHRRSISVDDPERRPRQQRSSRGLASNNGPPPARRPVPKTASSSSMSSSGRIVRKPAPPARRVQQPNSSSASANSRRPLANGGRGGRAPYTAHGTPSAAAATSSRTRQQQRPQPAPASAFGGSRNFDITTSPPGMTEVAPKLRRHNSAPDMGMMDGEGEEEQQLPFHDEPRQAPGVSLPQQASWGGGLPPTTGPAAARAAAAAEAAAAATAPARAAGSTAGSSRYPANDRESFARTLNEEELDEVWKGLGEGVSQRGCGSEVAFDPTDNVPGSPSGTAVSGAFPMLTANVLERHDQLADGCGGSGGGGSSGEAGGRRASVVPMPKQMGDRALEDMENGTRSSSKKSKGSNRSNNVPQQQQTTLLGAIVSTAILVLWVAHLVFNVLLLWPVVADHYVWAVCFVPGVLGILLSFNSCRKSHRHCKPVAADEEEAEGRPRRAGPHPCALPAHTVLLLSVVACVGMHAAAMLFCKKEMMLVFDEETLDPLCGRSLTLPVILDGVLLAVASLKASSLCWAWVLN